MHWAIINGEKISGVTTMYTDIGMDTGDILLSEKVPISEGMTAGNFMIICLTRCKGFEKLCWK